MLPGSPQLKLNEDCDMTWKGEIRNENHENDRDID
jgi:hypothetical protein